MVLAVVISVVVVGWTIFTIGKYLYEAGKRHGWERNSDLCKTISDEEYVNRSLKMVSYQLEQSELRTAERIKNIQDQSNLTLLASLWATVEAKGLQRSTIIQRVIEKYTPGRSMSPEEMAKVEEELAKLTDLDGAEPSRSTNGAVFDFDIESSKDPKDLV